MLSCYIADDGVNGGSFEIPGLSYEGERRSESLRERFNPERSPQIGAAKHMILKPKFGHWVIFDHCLPFDVTRAYDEATQYPDPRIWTAQREQLMASTSAHEITMN